MRIRLTAIVLAAATLAAGVCAVPAQCPMMAMDTGGCHETETRMERPCCCTVDQASTPALPLAAAPAPALGQVFAAEGADLAPQAVAATVEAAARTAARALDRLSLLSVLRL